MCTCFVADIGIIYVSLHVCRYRYIQVIYVPICYIHKIGTFPICICTYMYIYVATYMRIYVHIWAYMYIYI